MSHEVRTTKMSARLFQNKQHVKSPWRHKWCWAVFIWAVWLHISPSLQHQAQQNTRYTLILICRDYITCMKSFSVVCVEFSGLILWWETLSVLFCIFQEQKSFNIRSCWCCKNVTVVFPVRVLCRRLLTDWSERSRSRAGCFICVWID